MSQRDEAIDGLLQDAKDVHEISQSLAGGSDYMVLYADEEGWHLRYKAKRLELLGLLPFIQNTIAEAHLNDG